MAEGSPSATFLYWGVNGMKTLEIDIETHSSANLAKCGVYKYIEASDFEIILFGYSIDGGEVRVIDFAQGEKLPAEVLSALEDDSVIKWAFNSSFERICLSRFLGYPAGDYLDPSSLTSFCGRLRGSRRLRNSVPRL